jgi:hypothetical protein
VFIILTMLHTDSSVIPGWAMGPLEAAILRGIVVTEGNNYESENLFLRCCDERPRVTRSQELFSGCILLTQLSVAPQGQLCEESGRGNRHGIQFLRLLRIQFNYVQPHRLLHVWSNWYLLSRHRCCVYLI